MNQAAKPLSPNIGASHPPIRSGHIDQELKSLSESIDGLESLHENLFARLHRVIRSEAAQAESATSIPQEMLVPVAHDIRVSRERIQALALLTSDLLARLEV
jgi:hypothetical protein